MKIAMYSLAVILNVLLAFHYANLDIWIGTVAFAIFAAVWHYYLTKEIINLSKETPDDNRQ